METMSTKSLRVMGLNLSNSVVEGGSSVAVKGEPAGVIADLIFPIFKSKYFEKTLAVCC